MHIDSSRQTIVNRRTDLWKETRTLMKSIMLNIDDNQQERRERVCECCARWPDDDRQLALFIVIFIIRKMIENYASIERCLTKTNDKSKMLKCCKCKKETAQIDSL